MDNLLRPPSFGESKKNVIKKAKRFEREFEVRTNIKEKTGGFVYEFREGDPQQQRSFISKVCSSFGSSQARQQQQRLEAQSEDSPDSDFCADTLVKLSNGVTAYRLIEPSTSLDTEADQIPLVICLHDLTSCSYMWADVADLMADCEQGPQARVLVLDFYGRGRSPWTGVQCTLDVFVMQIKELLDCK